MVSVDELKNMGGGWLIFFFHVCPLFGFLFFLFFGGFFLLSASFCGDSMFHMLSIS